MTVATHMMYDHILFPTDGSDPAESVLEYALQIASEHEATIHLLNVADTGRDSITTVRGEVIDVLEEEGERIVAEAAQRARDSDVSVVSEVLQGDRFPNEAKLTEVFNERTYTPLRVIRDETPESIRETARLVGRDKKNVHEELTTLEALGVIRFEEAGRAKRPVFPHDDLVVSPLAHGRGDSTHTAVRKYLPL